MSTIFLSGYYDGNFDAFQRDAKKQFFLEQDLQKIKRRIINYLENSMLQIEPNDLLHEFIRNTNIEFSPDIKTSPYGITKQYIIDLLKKTKNIPHPAACPLNGLIDELIADLNSMSDEEFEDSQKRYNIRSTRAIQGERNNCRLCERSNDKRFCDEVYGIVEGMIWSGLHYNEIVAGEYCFETNTIILYLNAIKNNHSDDCIESVFAHELFHAYHMKSVELAGGKWLNKRKYQGNVVLESLAASFEYYYTKNVMENSAMCEENLRYWNRYSVDFWPYSGAKGIVKMDNIKRSWLEFQRLVNDGTVRNPKAIELVGKRETNIADSFPLVFLDSLSKKEDEAYNDIVVSLKYASEDSNVSGQITKAIEFGHGRPTAKINKFVYTSYGNPMISRVQSTIEVDKISKKMIVWYESFGNSHLKMITQKEHELSDSEIKTFFSKINRINWDGSFFEQMFDYPGWIVDLEMSIGRRKNIGGNVRKPEGLDEAHRWLINKGIKYNLFTNPDKITEYNEIYQHFIQSGLSQGVAATATRTIFEKNEV